LIPGYHQRTPTADVSTTGATSVRDDKTMLYRIGVMRLRPGSRPCRA